MQNLDVYQVRVLILLGEAGPQSLWAITQGVTTHLKSDTRKQVLRQLEDGGLVKSYLASNVRKRGPWPRYFELTPKGKRAFKSIAHTEIVRLDQK